MQEYEEIAGTESLSDSLAKLLLNTKTVMSCHSGATFPTNTANHYQGMLCYRTDQDKYYRLKSLPPATSVWVSISEFKTLKDVTLTTTGDKALISEHVLQYNGTAWVNKTLADASISKTDHVHTVSNLSDTTIATTPDTGDVFRYNGTKWVNSTLANASISKTDHTHTIANLTDTVISDSKANQQVLSWDGAVSNGVGGWVNKKLVDAGISATHSHPYLSDAGGTLSGSLAVSGSISATGNVTAYGSTSDRRVKKDVEVIENALSKVNALTGYTFLYNNSTERLTGVMAQEVQAVLPEAVYESEAVLEGTDEHILAVRHGNMVGLLIEAIKELSAEVDLLKSKLEDI